MALRLWAARRPLLARGRIAARRPGRRRPDRLASSWPVGRRARARLADLRRRLPPSDRGPARGRCGRSSRRRFRLRRRRALRRARVVPAGRSNARDDHGRERLLRDHPGALGADPREAGGPRSEPAARPTREATLGAQQLPDAAGRLHDARRPLSACVRQRPRLARPARDLRAGGGDPALLQSLAHGASRVVDPRRGERRRRRTCGRPRTGGRRTGLGADGRRRPEHRRGAVPDLPLGRHRAARHPTRDDRAA